MIRNDGYESRLGEEIESHNDEFDTGAAIDAKTSVTLQNI